MFDGYEESYGMSNSYWNEYHKQQHPLNKAEQKINRFRRAMEQREQWTPDLMTLKLTHGTLFPLFIYGDEKVGKPFDGITLGCKFYGRVATTDSSYIMFENRGTGPKAFMMPMSSEVTEKFGYGYGHSGPVEGELYGVPLHKLCTLDRKNLNGQAMFRTSVMIRLDDPEKIGNTLRSCYMKVFGYVGNPDYWKNRPRHGEQNIFLSPKLKIRGQEHFSY